MAYSNRMNLNRNQLILTVSSIAFLAVTPATSETVLKASDLFDVCTRPSESWISFCNGYMQAAGDSAQAMGLACIPSGTTRNEVAVLYEQYYPQIIANEPQMLAESAIASVIALLSAVFPCPEQ